MLPNKPYPVHDIYEDCRTILAELQIEMFNRINKQLYKTCHYNKPRKHHEMIKKLLIEFIIDNKDRSEEHTSELQSRFDLVCRLLLEKKKTNIKIDYINYK